MTTRFGFIPVFAVLHDEDSRSGLIAKYVPALQRLGGEQWSPKDAGNPAPLALFIVTGGTEQKTLDLWAERSKTVPNEPVLLLTHPGQNSLPAALETLGRLRQDGVPGRILYLDGPEDKEGFGQVETAMRDLEACRSLHQARIGLVGAPSDWLVASSPDPATVQKAWGPEVVPVSLEELYQALRAVPEGAIAPLLTSLVSGATETREPSPTELGDVVRVYVALKQLVDQYALNALTLRCFDLVIELGTTGCFALAQLNDQGIIAGCEGDLVSTVGMLWVYSLLGQLTWMANPSRLDEARNTLWLGHCTVPRGLVSDYRLRSHMESGLGVGLQGTLPTGPVTLLRIGGKAMNQLWLAEGEILRAGDAEDLCRTQAEVQLTRGTVGDLLHAPLGNHLVSVPGHHMDRLQMWWETMAPGWSVHG